MTEQNTKLDVTAEIDHTEIDPETGKKTVVVLYKGSDWNGDRVDRIAVPLNATKQQVKQAVKNTLNSRVYAEEVAERATEIRDAMGDPKGLEITPGLDPEKEVDDLVEYHGMTEDERATARKNLQDEDKSNGRAERLVDKFEGNTMQR